MSAVYRLQQGLRALGAWLRPVDDALAARYLPPPLHALYCRMRRHERLHSLRVLRDLLADGHTQPDLLAAALLHDVGKTRYPFSLPEKVLVVLVKAAAPRLYRRWGSSVSEGWRRPFAVSVQHPVWGADMVVRVGGSSLTATLIRYHAEPPPSHLPEETARLLALLQAADNRN